MMMLKKNCETPMSSLGQINVVEDTFNDYAFTTKIISNTSLQFQRFSTGFSGNLYYQLVEFIPREKRQINKGFNRGIMRPRILA